MKLRKITTNMMAVERPTTIDFDQTKNVKVFVGSSGAGKGSVVSSIEAALTKSCFIDILGKHVTDGRTIRDRLNAGEDIHVTLEHSKGTSSVDIVESKGGSIPRNWQSGYKMPQGANIAPDIKQILARTPEKMVDELVRFVVRNVKAPDVKSGLIDNDLKLLETYLKRKTTTPIEALNLAIKHLKDTEKSLKGQINALISQADPGAVMPNTMMEESLDEDLSFWQNQLAARQVWENSQQVDKHAIDVIKSDIHHLRQRLAELQQQRSDLPGLDQEKLDAYRAAEVLCAYASKHAIPICPVCESDHNIKKAVGDGDTEAYFKNKALSFQGAIWNIQNAVDTEKLRVINKEIEEVMAKEANKQVELRVMSSHVKVDVKPEYTVDKCKAEIEKVQAAVSKINMQKLRFKQEQGRQEKLDKTKDSLDAIKNSLVVFKLKKAELVDSRFDDFLEKTRYFMPAPQHLKGGVLHVNLERREVGFLRNGRLHLAPSGSELRTIVMAMALAAGSMFPNPPTVFLDDVGWGVELFEACANSWTNYKGEVIAQTTAKIRGSKLDAKVELIDVEKLTHHTKMEAQAIMRSSLSTVTWAPRPEDYGPSLFRSVVSDLPQGCFVKITNKIRNGREFVEQTFDCEITRVSSSSITAVTDNGVAFTIKKDTGVNAYDRHIILSAVDESLLAQKLSDNLINHLSYPLNHNIPLPKMRRIWQHMISAEDAAERMHLIEGEDA